MNEKSRHIKKIIDSILTDKKEKYKFSEIQGADFILENQVLKIIKDDPEYFEINFNSYMFNEILLDVAEIELNRKSANSIESVILFTNNFEEHLKSKYGCISEKVLSNLIKGLKIFCLRALSSEISVYDYFVRLINDKKQNRKERLDFVSLYFQFLLESDSDEEVILKSCEQYNSTEEFNKNYTYNFLIGLGEKHSVLAIKIIKYAENDGFEKYSIFIPPLIIGLFTNDQDNIFNYTVLLFEKKPIIALHAFCGFDFLEGSKINQLFGLLVSIISASEELVHLKSLLYCKLIENDKSSAKIKENCIKELIQLLESKDHTIAGRTLTNIQYNLDNFEYEKYQLLHVYLNNTKKIDVLKYFFYNYKNPQYLFEILVKRYDARGFRVSIDLFQNTLSHFFDTNREDTEAEILNLFRYRQYSLLAVKIILAIRGGIYHVDLLKSEKEAQLLAIESICYYPYSIDELLILLLRLRDSIYVEVKDYLQNKLSELIREVYHQSLLDVIKENMTGSNRDKKFIIPLQKALDEYLEMKEFKEKNKDLDPRENERNLMDLYYRLEHENRAEMMKNINKDEKSFLSSIKNVAIVRGSAWKNEESDQVLPLAHIESKMMIDSRAYKNPLLYEQKLEKF